MARSNPNTHSLAELDLFADCTRAELDLARSLLTLVPVPAGEVILREGSIGREFLIIADGLAAVSRFGDDAEQPVATLARGELVGEMALLAGGSRTATVTTIAPTSVYAGNSREFAALLEGAPSVAAKIVRIAQARRQANAQPSERPTHAA